MNDFKLIWEFYKETVKREKKINLFLIMFLSLVKVAVVMVPPIYLIDILDKAIPNSMVKRVIWDALIVLLFTIMESVLNYFLSLIYANITNNCYTYYQNKCLEHLFRLTGKYYSNMSNGDIFTTIFQDVEQVETLLSGTIFNFVSDCMIAFVMFFFLLFIQWDLLLVIMFILPIVFLVQRYYQGKGREKAELLRKICSEVISLLESITSNITPFLYSGAKTYCKKKYNDKLGVFLAEQKKMKLISAKNGGILNFLATLLDIIVLGYGGAKVIMKSLSFGGLVTFKTYTSKLVIPMLRISSILIELQSTIVSLRKIYDFFQEPEICEEKDALLQGINDSLKSMVFSNVNFSYCENTKLIKDIDCSFINNRMNVIVGESGCGKSTILALLFRLWDKKSGKIEINNRRLENYGLDYLRDNITIISQEMFLFDDTIMNNIILDSNKNLNQIKEVVRIACLEKFIDSLSDGYNTIIGEHGVRLSGGEKQRICLARGLLRDTPILILDEATSALDQITEKRVLSNLRCILKDKIVIIITHRLQAIVEADCIFVIKDGRLIANGTHGELMLSSKYYRNLFERKLV